MTEPQTEPRPGAIPPSPATPRRGLNPAVIVVVAIVVLIVIVAGLLLARNGNGGGGGADKAATAFFRTTADAGAAASYDTTSAAFRDGTTAPRWGEIATLFKLGQFGNVEWTQRDVGDEVTTVRGTLHRNGLSDLPTAVDLRKIDGTWKVAAIAFTMDPATLAAMNAAAPAPAPQPVASSLTSPGLNQPPPAQGYPGNYTVAPPDGASVATVTPGPTIPGAGAPWSRAGPPGSMVAAGQLGPTCMGQLWKQGVRNVGVNCPDYLATRPGASEQCIARDAAGFTRGVTATFLDYDPATGQSAVECHAN